MGEAEDDNDLEEDEDAGQLKKRRRKEAFFAESKRKKEAKKQERAEALERGEVLPEKEAPEPLKEPPLLSPQIKSFQAFALDPGVSNDCLLTLFQRFVRSRREVHVASEMLKESETVTPARRKALLRAVVDRLLCVEGQVMPLERLTVDPAIMTLRRGVAKSLTGFLLSNPEVFQVRDETNDKGKRVQMAALVGPGPASAQTDAAAELLVAQVIVTLQAAGGCATLTQLKQERAITERAKGVSSKLCKFLANYPDVFEICEREGQTYVTLLMQDVGSDPSRGHSVAPPEQADEGLQDDGLDPSEALTQEVTAELHRRGGEATLSDLSMEPAIRRRSIAVAVQLPRFLAARPKLFELQMLAAGDCCVRSLVAPESSEPPEVQDPKELLLSAVLDFLREQRGTATVSDMGQAPAVRERLRGISAKLKLSKFLAEHPDRFVVEPEGERQILVCRLLQ